MNKKFRDYTLREIQEMCKRYRHCQSCPLFGGGYLGCRLRNDNPEDYSFLEKRNKPDFTDQEKENARALKRLFRCRDSYMVYRDGISGNVEISPPPGQMYSDDIMPFMVNKDAFPSIGKGEGYMLEQIIES